MEDSKNTIHLCCNGCIKIDENLINYDVSEDSVFYLLWKVRQLKFCEQCFSTARICEEFLQKVGNVQRNLKAITRTLQNVGDLDTLKSESTPGDVAIKKEKIEVIGYDDGDSNGDYDDDIGDEKLDDIVGRGLLPEIGVLVEVTLEKEEVKEEVSEKTDEGKTKKCVRRKRVVRGSAKPERKQSRKVRIRTFTLSPHQFLEEKKRRAENRHYVASIFRCEDCVKGFSYKETFDEHMLKHDESCGKHVCSLCKLRFPTTIALKNHVRNHLKRFKCMLCGHVTTTNTSSYDHYNSVHSMETMYPCKDCDKVFLKKNLLKRHISYRHSVRQRLVCDVCQKTFANKMCLRIHISNKHITGKESKLDRPYVCPHCDKRYKHPTHLKNHIPSHTDVKNFYCVECDRYFKTAGSLKTHLMTTLKHSQTNALMARYTCPQCPRRYFDKRTMQAHVNRDHYKMKPFMCELCEKNFVTSSSLKGHMKKVHSGRKPEKKIPCPLCTKVFQSNTILQGHLRTHTGERPYQCELCSARFSQSGSLHNHRKLVHMKLKRKSAAAADPK